MNCLIKCLVFVLLAIGNHAPILGQDTLTDHTKDTIILEYFTGIGCPNCDRIDDYIEKIDNKYSLVVINKLEVFKNKENHKIMKKRYKKYGIPWNKQWVPAIFFEDKVFSGFKEIDMYLEKEILILLNSSE